MFSEYSASWLGFFGAGLTGFSYTTGGGGGASSSYSFFFGGGWGCSATRSCFSGFSGFSGFLMRAAEGGLLGLTSFFSSFFSGSGSLLPRTLLTYGSDDLPLVAHL